MCRYISTVCPSTTWPSIGFPVLKGRKHTKKWGLCTVWSQMWGTTHMKGSKEAGYAVQACIDAAFVHNLDVEMSMEYLFANQQLNWWKQELRSYFSQIIAKLPTVIKGILEMDESMDDNNWELLESLQWCIMKVKILKYMINMMNSERMLLAMPFMTCSIYSHIARLLEMVNKSLLEVCLFLPLSYTSMVSRDMWTQFTPPRSVLYIAWVSYNAWNSHPCFADFHGIKKCAKHCPYHSIPFHVWSFVCSCSHSYLATVLLLVGAIYQHGLHHWEVLKDQISLCSGCEGYIWPSEAQQQLHNCQHSMFGEPIPPVLHNHDQTHLFATVT